MDIFARFHIVFIRLVREQNGSVQAGVERGQLIFVDRVDFNAVQNFFPLVFCFFLQRAEALVAHVFVQVVKCLFLGKIGNGNLCCDVGIVEHDMAALTEIFDIENGECIGVDVTLAKLHDDIHLEVDGLVLRVTVCPSVQRIGLRIVSPAVVALERMERQTDVFEHIKMNLENTAALGRNEGEITSLAQETNLQKIGAERRFLGTVAGPAAVKALVDTGTCFGRH